MGSFLSLITFAITHITLIFGIGSKEPHNKKIDGIVSVDDDNSIKNDDGLKTFEMFIDAIAFKESSDDYSVVNRYGYMGRYQIGHLAMEDLGIYGRGDFLENHKLQDIAFISLLKINKYRLRKEIEIFVGKTIDGVFITESGVLSAAHLVGASSVKKFLYNGLEKKDGNGVSVKTYLKNFSGYEINIEAKRKINLSNYK